MDTTQEPVAGNWYANKTGKLFKVRLIGYKKTKRVSVVLEFLDGSQKIITDNDWYMLELKLPATGKNSTQAAHEL